MMSCRRVGSWVCVALALVVIAMGTLRLLSRLDAVPLHEDEPVWIAAGVYYTDLLLRVDFDLVKWEGHHLENFGALSPHLGKWILGFPLLHAAAGSQTETELMAYAQAPKRPAAEERPWLFFARSVSAWSGALACVVLVLIAAAARLPAAGLLAAAIVVLNPLYVLCVSRAMTDSSYLLFLLAGCLACLGLQRAPQTSPPYRLALLCGVCAALAYSVKVTGLLVVLGTEVLVLAERVRRNSISFTRGLRLLGASLALAIVLIHLMNPCLWPIFPPDRVRLASALTDSAFGQPGVPVDTGGSRLLALYHSREMRFPATFLKWSRLMEYQARGGGSWQGGRQAGIQQAVWLTYRSFTTEPIVLGLGLIAALWHVGRYWRNRQATPLFVPVAFLLTNYLLLVFFLKLNWDRYYLPTVVSLRLVSMFGLVLVAAAAWSRFTACRRQVPSPQQAVSSPPTSASA